MRCQERGLHLAGGSWKRCGPSEPEKDEAGSSVDDSPGVD